MTEKFFVGIFDLVIHSEANNNHKTEFSVFNNLPVHEEDNDDIDLYDDLCDYDTSNYYPYGP